MNQWGHRRAARFALSLTLALAALGCHVPRATLEPGRIARIDRASITWLQYRRRNYASHDGSGTPLDPGDTALGFTVVTLLVVGLIVGVMYLSKRQRDARNQRMMTYGAARGLAPVEVPMVRGFGKSLGLAGAFAGVPIMIDVFVVRSRRHSRTYTRVRAQPQGPVPGYVAVYHESPLGFLGDMLGAQDVRVGDPAFDQAFVVKAQPEQFAYAVLTPEVRQRLQTFPAYRPSFSLRPDGVQVVFPGADLVPEVLDAACALTVAAARSTAGAPAAGAWG